MEILHKGGPTPRAKQVRNRSPSPLTLVPTSDSDILDSDASDSSESGLECSTDSDGGTIPKPPSEAGRPGHGGYTLKDVCVVLSGDDQIIDAGEVRKYLMEGEEER